MIFSFLHLRQLEREVESVSVSLFKGMEADVMTNMKG